MKKKILVCVIALVLILTAFAACTKAEEKEPEVQNLTGELTEIVDKIYQEKDPGIKLMTNEVDLTNADALKSFTGLDSAEKIKSAVYSEPMMGSQAYSMVLIRLNDAADAQSVAEQVKSGINPAKWICVCAGDPQVVAYGDVIMMVMVDTELSDTVTADDIVSAFKTVCGGEFTLELK